MSKTEEGKQVATMSKTEEGKQVATMMNKPLTPTELKTAVDEMTKRVIAECNAKNIWNHDALVDMLKRGWLRETVVYTATQKMVDDITEDLAQMSPGEVRLNLLR